MEHSRIRWHFDAKVTADETPSLLEKFTSFLQQHQPTVVVCDVSVLDEPDLVSVNALARMALVAKRRDAKLNLTGVSPALWSLLRISGMDNVFGLGQETP